MKSSVIVSIITPCYNSGQFLQDAVESVLSYKGPIAYELIIVNDGSTDKFTLDILRQLTQQGVTIIHQENKGAAAARNTAVHAASGKYLLPLDSDNKIKPNYIDIGVQVLDQHPDTAVVHCDVTCFGDKVTNRVYQGAPLDIKKMLSINQVDMCSMIRRSVWNEMGGLDENLSALEDWDFFIRVYTAGWKFHYVPEALYEYRIRSGSLMDDLFKDKVKADALKFQVMQKNIQIKCEQYDELIQQYIVSKNDNAKPFRTFVKMLYSNYIKRRRKNS